MKTWAWSVLMDSRYGFRAMLLKGEVFFLTLGWNEINWSKIINFKQRCRLFEKKLVQKDYLPDFSGSR